MVEHDMQQSSGGAYVFKKKLEKHPLLENLRMCQKNSRMQENTQWTEKGIFQQIYKYFNLWHFDFYYKVS